MPAQEGTETTLGYMTKESGLRLASPACRAVTWKTALLPIGTDMLAGCPLMEGGGPV